MSRSRLIHRIAFASLKGINRILANELLARTGGSEEDFFRLTEAQLASITGHKNRIFDNAYRNTLLEKATREADFIAAHSIKPLYYTDSDYPQRLTDCDDAPLMLYSAGDTDLNSNFFIGIVGTRHATPYGIDFTTKLIENLARSLPEPPVIVSGLAFGIDISAHKAALTLSLPTVAVLAHPLNTIYPSQHRHTAATIARGHGALITEYTTDVKTHPGNFIARNRIIAGLCDCVVVVESAEKGGALITARLAADYNRDVFALPGRISDRYSSGCNKLIAQNAAALITSADDLITAMSWTKNPQAEEQQTLFEPLSPQEQAIVDYLEQKGEAHINQLAVNLNITAGKLMGLLVDLEFKGIILAFPGAKYRLA